MASSTSPLPAKRARFSPPDVPSLISSLQNLQARAGKKLVTSNIHIYAKGGALVQPEDQAGVASSSKQVEGLPQDAVDTKDGVSPESVETEQGRQEETYQPDPSKLYITSWKMSEHHYRRADCPFPTLARGLFTANENYEYDAASPGDAHGPRTSGRTGERIVGRGYDKFFNVGEVDWTKWEALQTHTVPPYHLTYKSNGCLILISALNDRELMVASKHSLGTSVVPKTAPMEEKEKMVEQKKEVPGAEGWKQEKKKDKDVVDQLEAVKLEKTANQAKVEEASGAVKDEQGATAEEEQDPKKLSKNAKKKQAKDRFAAQQKAEKAARALADGGKDQNAAAEEDETQKMDGPGHAAMGRKWLKIHLDRVGKEEKDLAEVLWRDGVSCILELCDDSFEEHVLATPEHLTGLHLHGMNRNTPHFSTLPPDQVADFAKTWGFIPTASVTLDSIRQVRDYADEVAREGKWKGDPIEGFVVRSTVADVAAGPSKPSTGAKSSAEGQGEPPYPPGSPFFFKIKFDEPYMMYRQWREITKTLLPLRKPKCAGRKNRNAEPWTKLGSSLRRPESRVYAEWVARKMMDEPEFFDHFHTGIVKVREAFLAWTETEGADEWKAARESSDKPKPWSEKKFLIAPIAIPGMGKTVLGVALKKLLPGMIHVQSDDVKTKKTGPAFLKNVQQALKDNAIVFADRNNHLPQHHEEVSNLVDTPDLSGYNITRIALVYDIDRHPPNKVLRLASERVLGRGENHQSLRPDLDDRMRHENIVKRFQGEFVPPEGGLFEEEIRLSVVGSMEDNLKAAVEGLFPILGKSKEDMPSDKALKDALDSALGYKVGIVKPLAGEPSKPVRYYALSVEFELEEMARSALTAGSSSGSEADGKVMKQTELEKRRQGLSFLDRLVDTGRIISKPHVTIVHEKTVADEIAIKEAEFHSRSDLMSREHGPAESMWKACVALEKLPTPTLFDFDATGLCWNDRVMTLIVGNLRPHQPADKTETLGRSQADADAASRVEEALCKTLVNVLHVTVGTGDETIPPYEARGLVEAWRAGREAMEVGGRVRYIDLSGTSTLGRVVGMN